MEAEIIALSGKYIKKLLTAFLCCKVCPSTGSLHLPCFCPFLVVDSTDELNEKDRLWSKKNLEETAPADSGSAPNEPPKRRSHLVSSVTRL